ncbi:MAG: hypothetical protein E2O83_03655 [Bacteroidetes bacterium]|nr:MAG: hypothetical protein E2O83_03655 [Bacteroidota bacterium]
MKTTLHRLKWIALTLSTLLVFQSCRVYHSKTVTVDEATLLSQHIKIKTTSNETYKFHRLLREDGKLYGITWRKGSTARKLSEQIVLFSAGKDKDEVKILLDENTIREYHLQNKTMSILYPILFPVILAALMVGLFYLLWSIGV